MLPKKEYGSGSTTCHHRRFQEWTQCLKYLKNYGLDYYKFIMISEVFDGDGYRLIVFLSKLL